MGMQLANDIVACRTGPDAGAAVASSSSRHRLAVWARSATWPTPAVFLCSNEARFITGAGLPVDGGMGM